MEKLEKQLKQYNCDKKYYIIPLYVYENADIYEIDRCIKYYAKKYQYRRYKYVKRFNK